MESNPYLGTSTDPVVAPSSDDKTMALLSHILTIVAGFIAPLIIYLIKKDQSEFVAYHAKESLNFQITVFIIAIALIITIIGIFLVWIIVLLSLVFVIIATIRANEGKLYKYPFSFRIIK
jgi:hypothetical protein